MSDVVIIDSGGANLNSVVFALERLGAKAVVSREPQTIRDARRVILPGVGAAADAMTRLQGLELSEVILNLRQPVLGICLGMQLLFESSEEGDATCLGALPGQVVQLRQKPGLRVPHMGWNALRFPTGPKDPLFEGVSEGAYMYFVHSFRAPLQAPAVALTDYGESFPVAVRRRNFSGVQFHPERSGEAGAQVLRNFLEQPDARLAPEGTL